MCGILGVAAVKGRKPGVDDAAVARMRDTMAHRGPDGAGLWRGGSVVLAHRRLKVVDLSEAAAQPMTAGGGRYALVYNGELYNDAEIRTALGHEGGGWAGLEARPSGFSTTSDTETVLRALVAWGPGGLARLRGMFALGFVDLEAGMVLLARDPLGIKPLYWAMVEGEGAEGGRELVFASEPRAILAHPRMPVRPDAVGISAYLTTIRTVVGERTMFEGVRTVRPGRVLRFDLNGEEIMKRELPPTGVMAGGGDSSEVRAAVEDSVRRHLRSDVPVCCLLSGGLDSSIVAGIARRELGSLHTYCSGVEGGEDLRFAREVAGRVGSVHAEALVTRELFRERWGEMVGAMGVPLSTPNEVAIYEVARRLRADGMVVALSGEGADELFAGYAGPVLDAAGFEGVVTGHGAPIVAEPTIGGTGGEFQLNANAWMPVEVKGAVMDPGWWRALDGDDALTSFYREEFEAVRPLGEWPRGEGAMERVQAHLRFHRRINLAGLLQRLDTATMLAGVEGRTPLADVDVGALAESLEMGEKAVLSPSAGGPVARTKIALRRAFEGDLPPAVVSRPKASFPLPFDEWVEDTAGVLRESAFARGVFSGAAVEMVAARPRELWRLAWPMVNVALWGERWWGRGRGSS